MGESQQLAAIQSRVIKILLKNEAGFIGILASKCKNILRFAPLVSTSAPKKIINTAKISKKVYASQTCVICKKFIFVINFGYCKCKNTEP